MSRIKKEDKLEITIFKPTEVRVIDINACLSGERNKGNKLTKGYLHLANYIIKKSLGKEDGEFGTHWVQIPYEMVRSFLTHDYLKAVDLLVKGAFLEVKDWTPRDSKEKVRNWKAPVNLGERVIKGDCKLYRIPKHLFGASKKYTHEKLLISKRDINKLRNFNNKRSERAEKYRRYICSMMQSVVLADTPGSRAIIEELYDKNQIRLNGEDYLAVFNHSPFNETTVDGFGYRCHSQVVNTPRELRPAMRFSDDLESELVEIDLVNSQPAILASINSELIKRFAPECSAAIPLFQAVEGEADWVNFQTQCFNGTIYETLRDKYNELYGCKIVTPITRIEAKKVFYVAAFSNYNYMETLNLEAEEKILIGLTRAGLDAENQKYKVHTIRCYKLFKSLFKTAHQLFKNIKNISWVKINPGEKHSNNCLLAQRVESQIIYTVFTKALLESEISKLFTIHDAFFLRKQDEFKARTIIQQEIRKLNLNLQLKNKNI